MRKTAWALWLTNQQVAQATLVPASAVAGAETMSVPTPVVATASSSYQKVPGKLVSVEDGTEPASHEVSTYSVTQRFSTMSLQPDGSLVETPILLPVEMDLEQTISASHSVTASKNVPAPDSESKQYTEPGAGSESNYVYHPAYVPAVAPATLPAVGVTRSYNVFFPDSEEYRSVSDYAPATYPATRAGTAPAITPATMTAVVVDAGSIEISHHGEASRIFHSSMQTLSQTWDEANFGSLESAVWSHTGQYLLFADSAFALIDSEDNARDAEKLGRIYKWDARTDVISVFLESAGNIGPCCTPESPAVKDKMTAGAVGLAWGWDEGELLVTQYANRRVVKLHVEDVVNGEIPVEKVVPWSGSTSPNADEGTFNGPHNILVAGDVALFTDPPMGLRLQAFDDTGKQAPFSWDDVDGLKMQAGATSVNGVYAVDQDRNTHLVIDDIQMPHGIAWSEDRVYVSGSKMGSPSDREQSGIFVYETKRGDPGHVWQGKMIDGSDFVQDGEGHFGAMASAGDVLLVAGPSGIYIVNSKTVEMIGFLEFSKCFPLGLAVGEVTGEGSFAFVLTKCTDSARPSLKRIKLRVPLESPPAEDMCRDGEMQSPVDLPACVPTSQPELSVAWGTLSMALTDGSTKMDFAGWPPAKTHAMGESYTLTGCKLIWRSEHTVNHQKSELELQCMHDKDFSDRDGVLSVLFAVGDVESAFLSQIQSAGEAAEINFDVLFAEVQDKDKYWSYEGSHTSMGCSESVDYHVVMEKVSMSMAQYVHFRDLIGELQNDGTYALPDGNGRAVQQLSGRNIHGCFAPPLWYAQEYGSTEFSFSEFGHKVTCNFGGCYIEPEYDGEEWAYYVQGNHVTCDQGMKQSPVNLEYCPEPHRSDRAALDASWRAQEMQLENNGHALVMTMTGSPQTIIDGTSYTLVQCHLHWGSEHYVDSRQMDAELQCVHTKNDAEGRFGIIGLFLTADGTRNSAFIMALGDLPGPDAAAVRVTADFGMLPIDAATNYWSYDGSITTPPCAEVVDWYVLMVAEQISEVQMMDIKSSIGWMEEGGNFRPPQPLHDRNVHGCLNVQMYPFSEDWVSNPLPDMWAFDNFDHSDYDNCHDDSDDMQQSPIDLRSCESNGEYERPGRLNFDAWQRAPMKVRLSNSHGVTFTPFQDDVDPLQDEHHQDQSEMLYSVMSGTENAGEYMYKLEHCSIHWGSEHTVDGHQSRAEMQCVQKRTDASERYGVLGVFWEVGPEPNAFLESIEDYFPSPPEKQLRHEPVDEISVSAQSAPDSEAVYVPDGGLRRLQESSKSTAVPASQYSGIEIQVDGAPAYLSAPGTAEETYSVPFEGQIPGYAPTVIHIPSPDYTKPTLQWPSDYYPALVESQVPAIPAVLADRGVQYTESKSEVVPAPQAVNWGFPQRPTHGIQRPFWRAGCNDLSREDCCSYLDGRHDQNFGQVCVPAAEGTFSTGHECEVHCLVTDTCPWGRSIDEAPLMGMCADQAEHWINFAHLFADLNLDHFWNYEGSQTMPPCREIVDWYVLMSPAIMSSTQFSKLQLATGEIAANGNFRPPQPLNGRVPQGCIRYSSPWMDNSAPAADPYPYDGDNWYNGVADSHAVCTEGTQQSPINLDACLAAKQPAIDFDWTTSMVELSVEHGLKVTPSERMSTTIHGTTYDLVRCQWHLGSEHTVDDVQHAMESHCVHTRGDTGRYGVLGIFWEVGPENSFLSEFQDSLPTVPALPSEAPAGEVHCGAAGGHNTFADSCDACGAFGLCNSGSCEQQGESCVPVVRNCGAGIVVHGPCAICPAGQCGDFGAVSPNPESDCVLVQEGPSSFCTEVPLDRRRLTETSGVVGEGLLPDGAPGIVERPASRSIPSTESDSASSSFGTPVTGGQEPGIIPTAAAGGVSLTPGMVPYTVSDSASSSFSIPATESEEQTWGFPIVPEHNMNRIFAPGGCTSIASAEHCCFFMDGLKIEAPEASEEDLHAMEGNAYGQPCRPVRSGTFSDTSVVCAPECWVTGDCEWYIDNQDSRESEAAVCADRFKSQGNSVDMRLLYAGLDTTRYWNYQGSFTTPPCTEVVDWFVMMDTAKLSQLQLDHVRVASMHLVEAGGNFRPPQPLHGRHVGGCQRSPEWYTGEYSNDAWGYEVQGAHAVCDVGMRQSPVDLASCVEMTERHPIENMWGVQEYMMSNTGHAIKLELPSAAGATTIIGGVHYMLEQCQFHWGSEHSVDRLQHRMEVQCVHTKVGHEGKYGMIGVLFQVGEEQNPFLASFEHDYPVVGAPQVRGETDFNELTAALNMRHYWSYEGSFTSPPCTEVVDWFVLMDHSVLSESQFNMLQAATGHAGGMADANGNFRPPQPLHGREVLGCNKLQWYPYDEVEWSTYVIGSGLACEMGREQSPVDLPECHVSKNRPGELDFSRWESELLEVTMENSHGIKIKPTDGQEAQTGSEMTGNSYVLVECNFHWGSEHTVNNQQYKVESQCLQMRTDGSPQRAGVVGVFWDVSESAEDHDFFLPLQEHFPSAGMADGTFRVDFASFFNGLDLSEFWNYHGSLTTPPCTEIVDWHVLMTRPTLSGAQFRALQSATGEIQADGNFRPPQNLNGRFVDGCLSLAAVTNQQAPDLYPYSADAWSWEVDNAHALCSAGSHQSPIALSSCLAEPQPEMELHWGERQVTIHAEGELKVELAHAAHSMIKGTEYHLVACSFHAGSEHQVDGDQFHLEMQCVHTQQLGGHAVVAQFWHVQNLDSTGSAFLSQITDHLPLDSPATTSLNFDLQLDHVDKTRYWSYEGSMTTPPCTEGVHWFVLMDTLEMSAAQLEAITAAIDQPGGNFRPPQDLHNRHVVGCAQHADLYAADNSNWAYSTEDSHIICETGLKQSPVDLNVCGHVMDRPAIELSWGSQSLTLTNNGHAIVAAVSVSSADTVIEGTHYTLAECHFRSGSEHFVEGMQQRMEVQCVHTRDGHNRYGVIGMFYDLDQTANSFLARIEDDLPAVGESTTSSAGELADVFAGTDMHHYWSYEGSFTTPPCTEVVDWYVLMDHAAVSQAQFDSVQRAIGLANPEGGNFRPPQPLHDRLVEGCVRYDTEELSMCDSGMQQSPIDLEQCVGNEAAQLELQVNWGVQTVEITNDDDTLRLMLTNPGSATSFLKGTDYTLHGCEFHTGSEHTINREQFDMELQCIHEGHDDRFGIVAILFQVGGSPHRFLQDIDSDLSSLPAEEGVNFDHLWAGLDRTKYWDYQGSMTISPCGENVDWFVMMQQADLSAAQLTDIQNAIGVLEGNFRPPQALHGRAVGGCVPVPEWYPYHSEDWSNGVVHANSICSTGTRQSPVDLTECAVRSAQPAINMNVGVQDVEVIHDGYTVKLSLTNPPVATMVGDVAYTLQHCQFHWGSEHSVETMQQRFEAQCVHTLVLDSDHYGIVGVFFRVGDTPSQFFTPFEDSLMPGADVSNFQANIDLLTSGLDTRHYWQYEGSFTTPPCSETVTWMVMMDHSDMSVDQFHKFQEAIGWEAANGNFRPPQPLHGRTISGCLEADYFPEEPMTTTTPPPPYVEEHSGACMGGWLGNNLRTGSVWGCHLACLELPACGYFSYDPVSNTCARYSPFQRCPEDTNNRYPTYESYRMNRPIFENPREVSTYDMVHAGPCAAGWLSTQNARMDTVDDCAQWCAGHLICRYFAFSATSQMCALYSAYSMCPARTDSRYSNTDWMSYVLYTDGEEVHPAAPVPEENMNFFFVHQGHCAAGWMSGHNINADSLEECITHCFTTPTCGYVSYSEAARTCSLYRGNALCPADSNYPDFASYRVAIV